MAVKKLEEHVPVKKDESLFQLVSISHQIQQALVESFGEMTPEIEKALLLLQEKLPDKADGYKFIIEDLKSQAEIWNTRAENLSRISKTFMNHCDRLKYSIKMACVELGVDEIKGNECRWKLQSSPPAAVIDDETKLPNNFKEIVQKTVTRKDLILEALKSGAMVPGAHLEQGSYVRCYANTGSKKK